MPYFINFNIFLVLIWQHIFSNDHKNIQVWSWIQIHNSRLWIRGSSSGSVGNIYRTGNTALGFYLKRNGEKERMQAGAYSLLPFPGQIPWRMRHKEKPVLWIRIRRIRKSVGLPDPHQDPVSHKYGSGSGSFHHQAKIVKKPDFYCFATFYNSLPVFRTRIRIRIRRIRKFFGPFESAFGSVRQRYGSEDPDPHTDPYQNVTDPQHWEKPQLKDLQEL